MKFCELTLTKFISTIVFFFLFIMAFLCLREYPGSSIIYLFFTAISFYYLYFLLFRKTLFIEKFLGFYLFLGYWFNFSFKMFFYQFLPFSKTKYFPEGVGDFDFHPDSFDKVLSIVSLAFLSIIIGSYIREKYFSLNYKKNIEIIKIKRKFFLQIFLSFSILIFILIVAYVNFKYSFFQRGSVEIVTSAPLQFLVIFMKWFFLIGAATIFAITIDIFFKNNFVPKYLLFAYLVGEFFLSISNLSRGVLFNSLGVIFGFFHNLNIKKHYFLLVSSVVLIVVLFITSIFWVNNLRVKKYEVSDEKIAVINKELSSIGNTSKTKEILNEVNKYSLFLYKTIFSRIHGIEGLMAVHSAKNKSFDLFFKSFESTSNIEISFFDDLKKDFRQINPNLNSMTTPGLFAFLYYSNSIFFLCLCCFFLIVLVGLLETWVLSFSNYNYILASVISQLVALRIWHFGHNPLNSYKILIAIFLNLALVFIILQIIKKFNK